MAQNRMTVHEVTLTNAGGAAPSTRVWDQPCLTPLKNINIFVTSRGTAFPAGNIDFKVYYGGTWVGDPFVATSTLSNGIQQGATTTLTGVEICNNIHTDAKLYPATKLNNPNTPMLYGPPISLFIENKIAAPAADITMLVFFLSEGAGDSL